FIEISAIAGAIEIIVGILRTRPPGMTLDKIPVYCWSMLVMAGVIVLALPGGVGPAAALGCALGAAAGGAMGRPLDQPME
ncbi:cbb3-type cytochrome c oxidase subunit I, partial [Azospirillum brasilense]|uniref:cbb3-type cytochrome c oxidase subunit I n=1 Tax=Azospirillum brasilense TaxID=192 RepID=UPI0031F301CC